MSPQDLEDFRADLARLPDSKVLDLYWRPNQDPEELALIQATLDWRGIDPYTG